MDVCKSSVKGTCLSTVFRVQFQGMNNCNYQVGVENNTDKERERCVILLSVMWR